MYYNVYTKFDEMTKNMISATSPFNYAKTEFEKYHSPLVQNEDEKFNFNITQTTKAMIADYLFHLQDWAVKKFKGRNSAEAHFKELGDTITVKTFNDWKNKRSLPKETN